MLLQYTLILMLIFVVELTVAICAFLYRSKVESGFDDGLKDAMNEYKGSEDWRKAVDSLQTRVGLIIHCATTLVCALPIIGSGQLFC